MTRYQVTFSRDDVLKYVGHLDSTRAWLRAFRRASFRLAHSAGFRPRPRLGLAAPLPVGITGTAEILEVTLVDDVPTDEVSQRLGHVLPNGLGVSDVVRLAGEPLAARVRFAVYRCGLDHNVNEDKVAADIAALLLAPTLPRTRTHNGCERRYDLRRLIDGLSLEAGTPHVITMKLAVTNNGAGRAGEVLDALGLLGSELWIERAALVLAD